MRAMLTYIVSAVGLVVNGMCAGACLAHGGPTIGWGLMFLALGCVNGYYIIMRLWRA